MMLQGSYMILYNHDAARDPIKRFAEVNLRNAFCVPYAVQFTLEVYGTVWDRFFKQAGWLKAHHCVP